MATKDRISDREALARQLTVAAAEKNGDGNYPDIGDWVDAFPLLNAIMCTNIMHGKPRATPTITFYQTDHGVSACLADRAANRKMWVSAPSVNGCWGELEAKLGAKNPDWRSEAGTKSRSRS